MEKERGRRGEEEGGEKRRGGKREGRRESVKNQGTVAKFKFCILKPVF